MKKMLLATALALLITGCAQQTFYCSKQTGSSSTKGNHHHHFFVSGIGQKTVDLALREILFSESISKTETDKHS